MTEPLWQQDAYRAGCAARITHTTGSAVVLDRTVFFPAGGGQPGDRGVLRIAGRDDARAVATTTRGESGDVLHHLQDPGDVPDCGTPVMAELDWDRRWCHMRMHTAMHLLSVVLPYPVTGGAVGAERSRLDFDMPDAPPDKAELEAALNALVAADHPVGEDWISAEELARRPELVKTIGVRPPTGAGRIRLVRIGPPDDPVDLQPCGGTHVRGTGEIGPLCIGRIEKKGRANRRVSLRFMA